MSGLYGWQQGPVANREKHLLHSRLANILIDNNQRESVEFTYPLVLLSRGETAKQGPEPWIFYTSKLVSERASGPWVQELFRGWLKTRCQTGERERKRVRERERVQRSRSHLIFRGFFFFFSLSAHMRTASIRRTCKSIARNTVSSESLFSKDTGWLQDFCDMYLLKRLQRFAAQSREHLF